MRNLVIGYCFTWLGGLCIGLEIGRVKRESEVRSYQHALSMARNQQYAETHKNSHSVLQSTEK